MWKDKQEYYFFNYLVYNCFQLISTLGHHHEKYCLRHVFKDFYIYSSLFYSTFSR